MPEQTPLAEIAEKAGASFVEDAGWLVPANFGNATDEYRRALESAALFDVSHRGKVQVTGKEAPQFLHNLCTNEIVRMPVGGGCEALLTNGHAKIVGAANFYRVAGAEGESFWLDLAPGTATTVAAHLDRFHISEDVEITDRTRDFVQLHLAGPIAESVLAKLLRKLPPLGEYQHLSAEVDGIGTVDVRRTDALGVSGYDLLWSREASLPLWEALIGAGARPAGLEAYEVLRIEAGTPRYGVDIDDSNLPQEVGRSERAVSFTKGCYIGQETVARIRTYGHVNRTLMGLRFDGSIAFPPGTKLYREEQEVGRVTSSAVSLRFGAIGLGYVKRGSEQPGTKLQVRLSDGTGIAEVRSLPFGRSLP
jgi:folate-binding protein YgfZ